MTAKAKPKAKSSAVAESPVAQSPAAAKKKITPATDIAKPARKKAEATPPVPTAKAEKPSKKDKPKKIKMVRDSFTMPEDDYAKLAELKKKCLEAGVHVKKSELLRAGLLNLSNLPEAVLIEAVKQVEIIKTGRPAKD